MQSDASKEEFIKTLDELIEFFKASKDMLLQDFNMLKEYSNFSKTEFISSITVLIVIAIALLDIDKFIGLILIIILLIIIGVSNRRDKKTNIRINNIYIDKIIGYDTIIQFLYYLKISPTVVDLSPLINKIKPRFRGMHIQDYEKIWIEELVNSLDIIVINSENNQKKI